MPEVLLRVRHGSWLYGTAGPGSDEDLYEVVAGVGGRNPWTTRYGVSTQEMDGREDTVRKDLGQWLREVSTGVPQACEAAWAPGEAVVAEADWMRGFRLSLRVGTAGWARHRRAMRNFATGYRGGEYAMKRARHAVRLCLSLGKLRRDGYYNPRLTGAEVAEVRRVAENLGPGDELWQTLDGRWLG